MINTVALRAVLQTELKKIHCKVYYEDAPDCASFPYLVYNLSGTDSKPSRDYSLDIDVWDKPKDASTTVVETLADNLENTLNELLINNDDLSAIIYTSSRLSINDPEPSIKRRRVIFDMRVYFK